MHKRVLGKGLEALIGKQETARFSVVPLERIRPNKYQPRKMFDEASLKELADSIREKGIIEPLVARRDGDGYELIAGERRLRAAKLAGLAEVPIAVVDATDRETLEYAIIENIQRENLNPVEEAEAYERLAGFGLTQEEVAKKVGKERATVANYMRLLKLPPEVKDELLCERITMGHARAILSLPGHVQQRELCKKTIHRGLSVRETERMANRWLRKDPPKKRVAHIGALEEELRKIFATKVSVKERNGRGKVEIEFYSQDERERIIEILRQA